MEYIEEVLGLVCEPNTAKETRIYLKKYFIKKEVPIGYTKVNISGMTCSHCSDTITKTLSQINGLEDINVDHVAGTAIFKGEFDRENLKAIISKAGYELKA